MGPLIKKLLALQEIDLQIISLQDKKAQLLDWINQKKSEVERQHRQFEERGEQLKRLKMEIKSSELELADATEHIRKLESQQIHVKTNQEYKALDKEIYEAKARQSRTEDFLLQKMELLEQETEEIRGGRQQLDLQASELQRESESGEKKIREVDGRVTELKAKRSELAATIEDSHLRRYDRIFNSKKGRAIVPLVNRACQGCHLSVPAAVESILRRHDDEILTCENCSRILYVPVEGSTD